MDREDVETFKTALCWTLGIILFLTIFFYDNWRIKVDEKAEEIAKEKIRQYRAEMMIDIEQDRDYIEINRTQLSQLRPMTEKEMKCNPKR